MQIQGVPTESIDTEPHDTPPHEAFPDALNPIADTSGFENDGFGIGNNRLR